MNTTNMGCKYYCSQIIGYKFIYSFFHHKKSHLTNEKNLRLRDDDIVQCHTSQLGLEPRTLGSEFRSFSATTQL